MWVLMLAVTTLVVLWKSHVTRAAAHPFRPWLQAQPQGHIALGKCTAAQVRTSTTRYYGRSSHGPAEMVSWIPAGILLAPIARRAFGDPTEFPSLSYPLMALSMPVTLMLSWFAA